MRVFWVTNVLPHPAGAGAATLEFELIQALAPRHDIHVVSSAPPTDLDADAVLATGARLTMVECRRRAHPTTKLGVATALLRARPSLAVWLGRDQVPQLAGAVARLGEEAPPDVVQITRGELADLAWRVTYPTGVLLFDAMTRALRNRLAIEPLARRRAQLRLESRRTLRFERRWYPRAGGLTAVSPIDAAWLTAELGLPVEVIESPIADRFFAPAKRPRSPNVVTFVGSLDHRPNVDAIIWLATAIWPLVVGRRPDAQLVVVGRGDHEGVAAASIRPIVQAAGGRLDANVPDILPYYWESAVVTAPLREGSGMRTKVLHALATGTPLVATPVALEGVPGAEHAWPATTAEGLADAIVGVLDDVAGAGVRAARALDDVEALRVERIAERHERWWLSIAR